MTRPTKEELARMLQDMTSERDERIRANARLQGKVYDLDDAIRRKDKQLLEVHAEREHLRDLLTEREQADGALIQSSPGAGVSVQRVRGGVIVFVETPDEA